MGIVLLDKAFYSSAKDDQNVSSVPESFSNFRHEMKSIIIQNINGKIFME